MSHLFFCILVQFNWYAPALGIENPPSLSKAYAYYEHVTLPRHFVGEQTADHVLRRAEPGETQRTELFSPWRTPNASLIEWGIGVDLYFSTLRIMAGVLFIVGLIHLPNLVFYRSDHYSSEGKNKLQWSLRGSAVCTSTAWVACLDCTEKEWHTEQAQTQFAYPLNGTAPNGTVMIQHNTCNGGNLPQGLVNMAGLFFLLVVLFLLSLYIGAREVRFDEDKLTSTDYSVIVKNPPKDAYNPDDWCDFFTQFAEKQ